MSKEKTFLTLEDICPANPEFNLAKTGKSYQLRAMNLQDQAVFSQMFGAPEKILEVFQSRDWQKICKITYRLMLNKDDFLGSKEIIVDDDGIKSEIFISGPDKLFQSITGTMEVVKVLGATMSAVTLGEPVMRDHMVTEMKKKIDQMNAEQKKQIGAKSSTSLQANTDTRQSSSASSQ